MALPRKKIIFALIPFLITTLAIIVFLVFFYWGDITIQGQSPFAVQYNGIQYPDTNGLVQIHSRAGTQTFVVSKGQYEDQTIDQDIAWNRANKLVVHFTYHAQIASNEPFTPPISYVNPVAVSDNQLSDIISSTVPRKIALPAGINNVVWSRDGTQACLLHTGSGSIQNQLLTAKDDSFTADPLSESTFDCQSGPEQVHTLSLENNSITIDTKTFSLAQFSEWTVTSSLYKNEVFIVGQKTNNTKKTIIAWDLDTNTQREWGDWEITGAVKIIGPGSLAIPQAKEIVIVRDSQTIMHLATTANPNSILLNQAGDTIYFIDSDHSLTFKNVFQENSAPKQLFQQAISSDKPTSITTLNDDQTLLIAKLSPDLSEGWYLFDKPMSSLLKVSIAPKK